jgi:hypothetical protein
MTVLTVFSMIARENGRSLPEPQPLAIIPHQDLPDPGSWS